MYYETDTHKFVRTPEYNHSFSKRNGFSMRWGRTFEDDPQWCPLGPEILDLEISTICSGKCGWCYKSNSSEGKNMSLDMFKSVLSKMPSLDQVALGIGDADANSDFVSILEHCRKSGVIPNYTTSGIGVNPWLASRTKKYCGAVAVSMYPHNLTEARRAIGMYLDYGMGQVNVHLLYHADNLDFCRWVLNNVPDGINAVVLLAAKPVGRASGIRLASEEQFGELVAFGFQVGTPLGFDSCSAPAFEKLDNADEFKLMSERCESFCFSLYCNVNGMVHPCSFVEGITEGIPILDSDFQSIWNSEPAQTWREELWANDRRCPAFELEAV